MKRKRRQRLVGGTSAGVGSGRGKRSYRWLKAWMERYVPDDGPLDEEGKRELERAEAEAGWWVRWLPRLFAESDPEGRLRILRWVAPLAGKQGIGFLREVLSAKQSNLEERELALGCLEAQGEVPEPGVEEGLAQVRRFVEGLGLVGGEQGTAEGEGAVVGLRGRFEEFPVALQGLALRELVRRSPDWAPGFVAEVLVGKGTVGLWEEVLDVLEGAPAEAWAEVLVAGHREGDKALRKLIRKVQYKRTVRGLPVLPLEEDEAPAIWRPPEMPRPEGLISMPSEEGSQLVVVMRSNVPKGMLVLSGLIHEERGIVDFGVTEMTRKGAERHKAAMLEGRDLGFVEFVEADAALCAYRLEQAYEKGFAGGREALEVYKAVRPLLKEVLLPEPPAAPIYAAFPEDLEEQVTGDRLGASAGLLEEEALRGWGVSPQRVAPFLEGLEEIKESRIIVSSLQKKDRMEEFFRKATAEIFSDPAYRAAWRGRLEDAAWVFYKRDSIGTARRLAALARFLEDPDRDASKNSFFVELVRRRLEERLQVMEERKKEIPSLIVKPT